MVVDILNSRCLKCVNYPAPDLIFRALEALFLCIFAGLMRHIFKVVYQVLLPFIVPAENLLKNLYSQFENGKAKAIRLSTLAAICQALDCQPGDILEYQDDNDSIGVDII